MFAPNGMARASSQLSECDLSANAPFSGRHASLPALYTTPANSVPRTRAFQGFPIPNMSLAKGSMDLVTKVKLRMLQSAITTHAPRDPYDAVDLPARVGR